mgnify:CR=1 FL=1
MSESLRSSRSLLEEAAKVLKSELTAGQKKLPPALQKSIKDKEDKKEDSHTPEDKMKKKDEMKMKKASKEPYHPGQGEYDQEEMSPAQKKMDMNKNGKIDGEDLAKLRAKKEQLEEIIRDLESKIEE